MSEPTQASIRSHSPSTDPIRIRAWYVAGAHAPEHDPDRAPDERPVEHPAEHRRAFEAIGSSTMRPMNHRRTVLPMAVGALGA